MSQAYSYRQEFGRHVRSCRRVRGLTQEVLAAKSGVAADTVRRLEHGSFSPSLETLRKIATGLGLELSTMFEAFELREPNLAREIADQVISMEPALQVIVLRILPLLGALSRQKGSEDE